jgi:hypothetical protein
MDVSVVDATMTRDVLREIGRRPVDASGLDVHVTHGVAYLRGRIDKCRGYYDSIDLHEELMTIIKVLRQKPGIRDVICEVDFGGPTLKERMMSKDWHGGH